MFQTCNTVTEINRTSTAKVSIYICDRVTALDNLLRCRYMEPYRQVILEPRDKGLPVFFEMVAHTFS